MAMTDEQRWGAMMIRAVCRPNWSFKHEAMNGISMRTIEKAIRLRALLDKTDDEQIAREINHKTIMLKAGIGLGMTPAHIINSLA